MSFYERIKDQVSDLRETFNYPNDGTAFGHFIIKECFSRKIIEFDYDGIDINEFIKEHIVDMSNDLGNDAIFTNQNNHDIYVFQFKYSNNNLLNTDEIRKNKKFIDRLLKINYDEQKPNKKLQKIIDNEINTLLTPQNIENNNYNIYFYYIDNTFDSTNIKTDIMALFTNYEDKGINFYPDFFDYNRLEMLYDDTEMPKNEIIIDIVEKEYFKKCSNFYDDNDKTEIETIVTSIKANSLRPIIEKHKEMILALNVRYYKGENEINSKIKHEYSKGSRSNFWILNNGINSICEDFKILNENKLQITNFQIVNGGQTTKTLTRIVNELPDNVQILMRLTKINKKSKISKISKDIAVASNSQNAISTRDLHSGDRIQVKIFKFLDDVGIFYDKKDGEWATVEKSKYRNPFGKSPLHLKIKNIDIGISFMSFFLQIPISTKGRYKLVFSDHCYDNIFSMTINEEDQFHKLMLSYRISEKINQIKNNNIMKYEILQNNYINDVILALSAIYFFKNDINSISTIDNLKDKLKTLHGQKYISKNSQYCLEIGEDFDNYILKIINSLQNRLDVKKEGKKEYKKEDWISTDTNNWLKKDGTYKEIYEQVHVYLKRIN
ncbi:MAG: AIPR family protein [Pseudomonadota bacterium]